MAVNTTRISTPARADRRIPQDRCIHVPIAVLFSRRMSIDASDPVRAGLLTEKGQQEQL